MNRFETRRRVPFTAQQMYALVADVERYPEFLPLCERLRVTDRRTEGGRDVLIADMTMGYHAIRETITSKVTLYPDEPKVTVAYLNGPFSRMENRWLFKELGGDPVVSEVEFYIAYELRSLMLKFIVSQVFDRAFRKFASAFERRAHDVYGRKPAARLAQGGPITAL
ncbi:MAG: type II toxin-antitoxin system RatA family toxin [Hyphomicrobiaceae bacterium]